METKTTVIFENAGKRIRNSVLETFTIQHLAVKLNINENKLYNQFTKDDDIILAMLIGLETEFNEFVQKFTNKSESPEEELRLLFKRLHSLFLQKPYYLTVIFDKSLVERNIDIQQSFLRIKNIAVTNLTEIINKGKKENTFKTKESTKSLVRKILIGFRLSMKDEQLINEMVAQIETLRTLKD